MEQTSNYQLSQWNETDRILMENFNADNQKIDAALAEMQNIFPVVRLLSVTTTEEVAQVNLDVSDINLEDYWTLHIYVSFPSTPEAYYVVIRNNNVNSGYINNSNDVSLTHFGLYSVNTTTLTNFADLYVGKYLRTNYVSPTLTAEVSTLNVVPLTSGQNSSTFPAGTVVQLHGVKR